MKIENVGTLSISIFGLLLSDDLNLATNTQFDDTGGSGIRCFFLTEIDHVIDSSFHSITDSAKHRGEGSPLMLADVETMGLRKR